MMIYHPPSSAGQPNESSDFIDRNWYSMDFMKITAEYLWMVRDLRDSIFVGWCWWWHDWVVNLIWACWFSGLTKIHQKYVECFWGRRLMWFNGSAQKTSAQVQCIVWKGPNLWSYQQEIRLNLNWLWEGITKNITAYLGAIKISLS